MEIAHQLILNLVQDEYDEVLKFTENFGLQVFQDDLFLPVYEEMRRAYHFGKKVVILSAAPDFIVKAISKGIGNIEAYGTVYRKNEFQTLVIHKILTGKEKASLAKKIQSELFLQKSDLTAYSDSIQDLELLCSVGQPVVVNPDPKLQQIAKEENWRSIA